ncbi:iron ABC transporter permease [Labrenzia aggregata]|uniref:Iron ABC transporter permease n=1 Tax=Roseibium aggregatum TaxID=187304 RepID=A0A939EFL4_9HYPH|nr:iron ABC transporter permease [Roseibium aggregatum]MBN9672260.1 iron ABC transporter permease [Roseibium aggregatum]
MLTRSLAVNGLVAVLFATGFVTNLAIGTTYIPFADVLSALLAFNPEDFNHYVVVYQRLPRALIAIYVGAMMAASGLVTQGMLRNPLAAPSTIGINAGATLFVVTGAFLFDLGLAAQGVAALAGAATGFVSCLAVARLAGGGKDPRGLSFILAGGLVSMLYVALSNAVLLSDPARRSDFLGWITGNINHVYADRLYQVWGLGAASFLVLLILARPLTLIMFGEEKAASIGVNVVWTRRLAFAAVLAAAGSAVAICGPVGFVGLVVPHIVRPLVGARFSAALPASAFLGALVCLLADLIARQAFPPYVLHTGIIMDLVGGLIFVLIVKRYYLAPNARPAK